MDLLKGKIGAQEVATATGTTPKQVTDWCNQGHIIGQDKRLGKGRKREFTFSNIMEIAGGVALMEVGLTTPGDAFRASSHFAHIGSGQSGWVNDEGNFVESSPRPPRWPGLPHHHRHGETFLAVSGQLSNVVLSVRGEISTHQIFPMHHRPAGFILLNMTEIFKIVVGRMDIGKTWAEVLDEVYGR